MRRLGMSLLLLCVGALNISFLPRLHVHRDTSAFVTRSCTDLLQNGKPLRFVGANCYRLAEYADWSDEILGTLGSNGVRAVRFWAFQFHCGPSGTDFSRFDKVVSAARRHDVLLLPVLENHWGARTYGPDIKPPEWYRSGWRADKLGGAPIVYLDYIRAVAAHFRDERQILAWQLMNEPEIWPDSDENFAVLRAFATEAAREIRRLDPNHLISLGLLGLGQPSTAGKRFRALHDLREIDFVSAHDYGYIYEPLPGKDWKDKADSLYGDLRDARALGKPFVATEAGIPLEWMKGDRRLRAELFRAKLRAFFDAGGVGYMLWNYEPLPDTDHGFDAKDPLLGVMREAAARLHPGT